MTREIKTPYQRLLEAIRKFMSAHLNPEKKLVWVYPAGTIKSGSFTLFDIQERAAAADMLGWDTVLKKTDKGLEVWHVRRAPNIEYSIW